MTQPSICTRIGLCLAASALTLSSCASTRLVEQQLEDMMVGVAASDVRKVYGAPDETTSEGDYEALTYVWRVQNVQMIVERRGRSHLPSQERQVDVECTVTIESKRGVVTGASAQGRSTTNGIFDRLCTRKFMGMAERTDL